MNMAMIIPTSLLMMRPRPPLTTLLRRRCLLPPASRSTRTRPHTPDKQQHPHAAGLPLAQQLRGAILALLAQRAATSSC